MEHRNRNDRAELGEQSNMVSPDRSESMERTNVERSDRTMGAGAHGDGMAGSEGIEDPTREGRRQQGREPTDDAQSFGGQGAQRESNPQPEGTGYTGDKDRDSTTDDSDSENPLV